MIHRLRNWFRSLEAKREAKFEAWMEAHPPVKWKVYSTNSYNRPPAKSVVVLARTYGDAIDAASIPGLDWVEDPTNWNQDWGGWFAVKLP